MARESSCFWCVSATGRKQGSYIRVQLFPQNGDILHVVNQILAVLLNPIIVFGKKVHLIIPCILCWGKTANCAIPVLDQDVINLGDRCRVCAV